MNEFLFLTHTLFVFGVTVVAVCNGPFVLQTLLALYIVLGNLFVAKKMLLCGVLVSGCDVYVMAGICGVLMGREMWGTRFVRDVSIICTVISALFLVLCWFQTVYQALPGDAIQAVVAATIGLMPRITIYQLAGYYAAQLITLLVVTSGAALFKGRDVSLVAFLAMALGHLVDSIIFLGGCLGLGFSANFASAVLVNAGLKIVLVCASAFFFYCAAWLRRYGYAR